jgi:hypothetical protein
MESEDIPRLLQNSAESYNLPLLVDMKMEEDDYTIEYHRETMLYQIPLSLSSSSTLFCFELLAYFSEDIINFASKFPVSTAEILDFPTHVLPTLETLLLQKKTLFLRFPSGNHEINLSPMTLHHHLSQNRRISEKLLHRWTIQILRSLKSAHQKFFFFPEFDSTNIHLLSDECILSAYRQQRESKKKRNRAEEEIKASKLNRQNSGRGIFKTTSSSSFSSSINDIKTFPDINSNKSQFKSLLSQKSQDFHPLPSGNSSLSSQSQSSAPTLTTPTPSSPSKIAPRKDAWLFLPFVGMSLSPMPSVMIDETLPVIPTLNPRESSPSSHTPTPNPAHSPSIIAQWLRKYKINRREKIIKEQTMHELVSIVIRSPVPFSPHSLFLSVRAHLLRSLINVDTSIHSSSNPFIVTSSLWVQLFSNRICDDPCLSLRRDSSTLLLSVALISWL